MEAEAEVEVDTVVLDKEREGIKLAEVADRADALLPEENVFEGKDTAVETSHPAGRTVAEATPEDPIVILRVVVRRSVETPAVAEPAVAS